MGCFSGGVGLSLLLLCGVFYTACSKGAPDNRGTEFIIGYMENSGSSIDVELFVTTTRTTSVTVTVDAPKCKSPKISSSFKISSGQVKQLFLKPSIRMAGSSKSDKGVRVQASDEIVIYGINKETYSCDGFIGIPLDVLSDEYYVVSWYPSSYNTALLVVGVQDSTSVSIKISDHIGSRYVEYSRKKYYKGNVVKETLNKYETWQLVSTGDLTGSYVKSNKPVSVFSGNQRTTIGVGTSSDHLVEQMMPVNTWGKTFATVPIPKRTVGDYFKFTASVDNTKVTISGGYKSTFTISKAGSMVQKLISSKAYCKIVADKPIMVAQFVQSQQSTSELSDPAMMIIPPWEQYGADYTFATPKYSQGSYNNYFMFIVEESQKSGLRVDGKSFPSGTKYNTISGTSLVGGYISVTEGTHTIRHTSPIAIFGGFLYGQAKFETYGFTTGMRMAKVNAVCVPTPTVVGDGIDNDCDGKIDEELCTPENKNKDDDGDGKKNEDCAKPAPIDGKWSTWSSYGACSVTCQASSKKVSGTKARKRTCTDPAPAYDGKQCVGSASHTASCTPSNACPVMKCYTCSKGKKNSDCTKIEECKKDEESCETKIRRDKAEISKKCVKTKYCKAKCDKKDKECTLCCTGELCNKNQGYAEFKSWGSWSSCSNKCGGGKQSRTRTCSSTGDVPCSGDTKEEQDCNNQACLMRCYTCSYGKKNSDCTKMEECKKDEESCETKIRRDKAEIKKKCQKTKYCKAKCEKNDKECTLCCTGDLCNKNQGYAEFKSWGSWSSCNKKCGGGKRSRTRTCSSTGDVPCSGDTKEEQDCNNQACPMRCYTCSYGKKNSDCSKTEECKKDEQSCETKIRRDKAEIKKSCKKTKDCKAKCDKKDKECTLCCTGDLCNKDQGYAEFKSWGSWSSCNKKCGGGKRSRTRTCSSTGDVPCSGDTKEEQDCNNQACPMRCYTCSYGKKNSDCSKTEECKKDEQSCETKIRRDKAEIKKSCKKTKDCKAKCDKKDKECTLCCTGDLCNKNQGYAEFKSWGSWSSCNKQCGGGKRSRTRTCSSTGDVPCSGDTKEEQDCNNQACPLMRCYTCSYGKKNSDCTKIETCKKDEESCETKVHRDKAEIKKKCKKTKDCKAKCDKKEKECTLCCTGDLCNKNQGYAEFKTWGQWSSCNKQCGGGKRTRSRECSNGDVPCSGDTREEQDCNKQPCSAPAQMRCYTCSYGKKNSDCTKIETCKKDEESCETQVHRDKTEIKKKCKKTKDCKAKCDKKDKECTFCCTGDLCNKNQGYAEFKTWGQWSSCSKQCGGGKRKRSRECSSSDIPCTGDQSEEQDCNLQSCSTSVCVGDCKGLKNGDYQSCSTCKGFVKCSNSRLYNFQCPGTTVWDDKSKRCEWTSTTCKSAPAQMRCYTCSYGKKNSDCTKIETCKKDEESCETQVHRDKAEIKKKCKKTKDCKAKCDKKEKECTLCCTGDLCNKNQGYAEFKTWGQWSSCSKQCGGGKRTRSRECSNGDVPCSGDTREEQDCNKQTCSAPAQMRCYTCSYGKKNSDCTKIETCKKDEESCETQVHRDKAEIKKKCKKTKDCKAKCDKKEKECTLCCTGDLCNKNQGYAEFKTWGQWSSCSKQCGGGKRTRSRECSNGDVPCSGDTREEQDCNKQTCSAPAQMRCYTCSYGKKNSDCTKIETCKKDEESCETQVHRDKAEIKKKCKKTKDCKAKCDKKDKECTLCCTGDLCNKNQGYAEFKTWGQWSSCSKQCGGGKRKRSRECSSSDIPCTGDQSEEQDCNPQSCSTSVCVGDCKGLKNGDYQSCSTCKGFVKCSNSRLYNFQCPGTTVWDDKSKRCEWTSTTCKSAPAQMRCYTCSYGKKNSDCTKIETCKKDEESCETQVHRDKAEIKKKCKKTKDCKAKCDKKEKECTLCCTGDLCNKNQGYAEFKTWGQWSSCSKQCGGGKRTRSRECSNGDVPCSGDTREEQDCNKQTCSAPAQMRCYTCSYGKKNSDCTKIETCKKDEESCETQVHRDKAEIKKKCKKTKDCKAKCDKKEKECTLCCTGDLCNKNQGYAEFKTWGQWSSCSKQCGGGKRTRSRECSNGDVPCSGDTREEQDCNKQTCSAPAQMRCYTCSYGKKNSDCTKIETCKKDEESCETQVHRDKAEIKKKCKKTKDCKAKCDKKDKECTLCCTGDLCNKNQGYAEFKTWGQWSSCSKQCGGGKRKRSRECSSSDIPCTGDQSEEQDCNPQSCSTSVCVGDCKGLKNGDYQSCSTCKGFVKCSNSRLYNFQCPGTTVWDDKSKRCEWTSTTCKSAPAQMRCYTCSYGKKNSDCTKIETCKKDEESCETQVHRDKAEIKKKCKKTKDCKAKCDKKEKECTLCCTGDLCNKNQGYAEFKTWGQWSSCSKQCGGGKRTRSRECSNGDVPCSGDTREEQDCNKQTCSAPAQMRCYTCSYGKKNSDCTKIETCKKDEESCETQVHRDKAEIKKKCKKTKDCKAKCDKKEKECTLCCTGDLCNKNQGYAEFKTWGQWSSCSKQCGGGKRTRSRECSNGDVPCSGDTREEQDCNKQTCSAPAQMRCYTCSYGKKNSDCTKIETCKKDEESCETQVHRDKAEIKKKCKKTKDCKAKCDKKDKECTLCCTGDLCNKNQGYAEFKTWGQWSSCSKQCGGGKRKRSRECSSSDIPCTGDQSEEQDCNPQSCSTSVCVGDCKGLKNGDYQSCSTCKGFVKCSNSRLYNFQCPGTTVWDDKSKRCEWTSTTCKSAPAQMRCYTCSYGKKNSDCTKIETCKKDEESCETQVHRDKAEIKKKCKKTKDCKAKCDKKEKECTLCCTGDLCNKNQGYAEFKTWGQWSSCSKQCGGGKRTRSRECSNGDVPCSGDTREEQDCNKQTCSAPAQMRCYTCSYGKKNSDCTKIETCKKDEESCETQVHRDKAEIKKKCKKTKDCKAKCDKKEKECTLCCTGDLCNKNQGYAEFKTWGQWSSCSKQCGGGKRTRSRECSNGDVPCSGDTREEQDCNKQTCSAPAQMRCYTCSYGKKNSDCTKIETCKKDEESCETQVHRDKAEIKKKCKKTKDCKAKCDKKDKECTLCCTGDLCNKNQGYAEFKTWGQWSSCSKQCGGGKRKRSRECSSSDIPCTGDQSEEQDCNPQSCSTSVCVGDCKGLKNGDYQSCSTCKGFVKCSNSRLYNFQCPGTTVWDDKSKRCEWTSTTCKSAPAQMRCYTCSYGKKNSDCTKIETCKKDEESCETQVHRDKAEIKKKCKKTKDCKAKCDKKEKECTLCCTGDLCNKNQGYAEFKTWGQWSSCSKQCGGGKRTRSRECSNGDVPCSGDTREEQDCNKQTCSAPAQMRCYTCSYGKKNSDCTKIETCKKDEESCETQVHRDKAEIKKKCKKTKDCKAKCDKKDKECTLCCTGDLCNKNQGYAEFKTWGQWSSCSKQCGGGKRKRSRECSSSDIPCTGDQSEEQDCNPQSCSTSVCVGDCKGLKNGDYQSCSTCKGFVKCSNSRLYNFQCPGTTVWDDKSKRCEWTSTTCKSAPAQMRCYTCSYGKKNSDCTKIETCKKDEESCETQVHRDKAEIKKKCKKTKDCKAKCDKKEKECTLCCTGDLCNKNQGYAEFKTWGQWSSCSKQCGGGKRTRSRECSNGDVPCSGDTREEQDCNKQTCSAPAQMRCYTCSYGKKNSDCTKIETCKKDEESCETQVHRDKAEIKKKCKKTKDCKAKCDKKEKECTLCCTGDLCNKNQGYAEFKTWGQWSSCSKQCGGGKRTRSRECSNGDVPCSGDTREEQDCNKQTCSAPAQMRCYTCSYGKKNSDCTKIETCKKDEESCETQVHRDKAEIKKKCKKTKDCKAKCDKKDKECTLCCTGDLCNKNQGYAEFKTWGQWSSCSKQCGGGKRKRSRECSSSDIPCTGDQSEEQDCNPQSCSTSVCVGDCKGLKNGDYQSCSTCKGFVKCSNSRLYNFQCPGTTVWDDKSKRCEWTSTTCKSAPAQMRCYTCSFGKKNSDCTKIETCKKDEESCETQVHRDKAEIKKTCKKTKDCKAKCDKKEKECTLCCTGDLCNKNQGYAEFKTWGQWSSCSKQCGGGKRTRSRECSNGDVPCSGDTREEQDCNKQTCSAPAQMRCYTCSYGKKNSDCTKIETCKKDEESCETQVHRDKAEIKKKCKKTKDCKAKCDKKEKECTLCCTGDLCNKNQGYAEFKTWGQWSSCSKQCGGGKRKRSRECSSSDIPCTGDQSEEQDCNLQSCSTSVCVGDCKGLKNGDYQSCSTCKGFVKCSNSRLYNFQCPGTTVWDDKSKRCEWTSTTCKSAPAQMRCFTCSYGKKNSDCTKIETCKKDEESCETKVHRDKAEIKKTCKKMKDCKAKCDKKEKECTLCCTGDLCNKNQGYAEFKTWGQWSSCSKQCGGGKRTRSRECSNGDVPCSGDTREEEDCNKQTCSAPAQMRCYTCSNGKKNSDCTRIETCRKDEESCETKVSRDKAEIKKRCKKSKDCKPTCDKKDKECTMCCTGDLCNKVQGYAEFRSWGSWSSCSKKCGGGKRRRSRVCSFSGNAPCLGDTTEEQDCNRQPCIINQLTCFSCSFSSSNEACNKQRRAQTCQGGQNKCGTRIDRRTKRVLKTCASTCTPSCDLKTCTFCCDTPNCNKEYGTYGPWSKWEMEKVNNVNRLKRTRVCTSKECSGKLTETKDCTPALCKPTVLPTIKPQQFGCYTCSNAKSNDECKRKGGFKTCPTGQDKCGTRVDKRTNKIIKACTNVCKPNCDRNACTYCCTTPGCNNEFGTYGQWSPWKQETRNNVEILVRKRKCLNDICSGKDEETKSCTPTLCKAPAQRCYVCSKAKSNGACSKVETCKKDEESCETKVYRNRYEISKKCMKTKDCRPKCDPNDDSCVTCCKGPLCNKEDGYAKWSIWGPWTSCNKQCGGGLKRRKRACSTTSMPCSGSDLAEMTCNTQPCTTLAAPVTISPNSSQFGCYICNHEKNSDACNRNGIQACPRGQQVCGTRVDRNTKTVMKACTAACKPSCTTKACTFCCSSTGCNKEYGRYGQWSSWKEKKDKGGKKVLVRSRACLSKECSEVSSQTKPCTPALCSGYEQRCYVCNKGKKNSDCSKIETCKKDEHTCETRVEKGRFEITKQCRKEKECKPRCDPKDAFCVSCCTGSLCNKDEGYGKYGNWGIWTPCSKRCGGGRQKRFRRCSSSNMPCDGPSTEERACNTASCVQSSECHRCTNAKNNGDCNKQMKDTCSAYQSCETKINRQTKALTKKCTSTSACKTLCHGNSAICTFCCQGDNCNEGYGEWAPWSAWALKNGKKSRTRTCNTIECSGESTEEENCIGTSCSGVQNFQCRSCSNARSDAECNFGPLVTCPADKHTCQTRVERATGLTSKGCASPSSCTQACTAGSPTCMFCCSGSTCNENYGTWGGWGAWSITGTKGSLMTRKRTCASILCSGEGVETLPCRGPICSQFRCQACNNATSNEDCNRQGFQTCGSNDDTCGTSVTRATSRISKGCKPKGQCRPWCDAVSCTFCCNSAYCNDVYGVWQLWTSWKVVLVNNVYKRQRTRNCVTTLCSGDDKEEEGCTGANCTTAMMPSIDGGFTDWSTWSSCSKTCGGGTSEKSRTCSQPVPQNGGRNCTGSFSDSRDCNTQSCPVDGNWGIWGPWASCSKSCGGGKQHRERKCDDPTPAHGGTNCTGDTMQLDDCNDILCPLPSSGQYVQKCPPGWFTCKSGGITCIDVSFKCDCANDCDDGSDEEIAYASCTISQMQNCNSGTDHIRFSWWILLLSLTLGLMALR